MRQRDLLILASFFDFLNVSGNLSICTCGAGRSYGSRRNVWTVAKNTWEKGLTYAYRDRKQKKRDFRALWIQRINAAARQEGLSYSMLMGLIHKAGIEINRKVLAELAMNNPAAFKAIVEKVKG